MTTTKIIATLGPASANSATLEFFQKHSVQIARLNFSHNTPESHLEIAILAREHGLELLFDLPGPKIRLGELAEKKMIEMGREIILEPQQAGKSYPYEEEVYEMVRWVFPNQFPVHKYVEAGHTILIDDGKLSWKVQRVEGDRVFCRVVFGGMVGSRKGMNMPDSNLVVDFLGERDHMMLDALFVQIKPEYVAASFVKSRQELMDLKKLLRSMLEKAGITDYFPKVVPKLEMGEAVTSDNLQTIVAESDVIMIARGDLALEARPLHIVVPFLQEKIKQECRKQNKPFIVATQILETMIESPVPTRAEVSDLYRAVVLDQADFVMLSGEAAMGSYPEQCVELMHTMITQHEQLQTDAMK